jgi:hypothetical protein
MKNTIHKQAIIKNTDWALQFALYANECSNEGWHVTQRESYLRQSMDCCAYVAKNLSKLVQL